MEIIGKIIESSTKDEISSIKLQEEKNDNVLEVTNLRFLQPVSLIINKTGQIVRKLQGILLLPQDSEAVDKAYNIEIDVTSQPGLGKDFNSEAYKGLNVKIRD